MTSSPRATFQLGAILGEKVKAESNKPKEEESNFSPTTSQMKAIFFAFFLFARAIDFSYVSWRDETDGRTASVPRQSNSIRFL